ncbi:hypothetical protein [Polyangium sp. 15x6]|uniref:hypothetical protein n=1 Tax=Polyangium sp. 15x6 TaxID=3042687 RepID=UPI002499CAAB|nr:hypothetical protein [Polyangium sp. 15x6]MDI3291908.1 hypothetical protein [Polyangium sp. 15x6]
MPVTWGAPPTANTPSTPAPAPPVTQTQTVNVVIGPTSKVDSPPAASLELSTREGEVKTDIATISGDGRITLANGERIAYAAPAALFLLDARNGVQRLFIVDDSDQGLISDAWMFDGKDWHHRARLASLPLDRRITMPVSLIPPQSIVDRLAHRATWLVSEGVVVPGPDYIRAVFALYFLRSAQETINDNDAAHRNMIGFSFARMHFYDEGLRPCDHLRERADNLFAGFVRMNRTPWPAGQP